MKVASTEWTGRAPYAGTPIDVLERFTRNLLWPSYPCTLCVGQEDWLGCYCAYHGAPAPGSGPSNLRVRLRELHERVFPRRWMRLTEDFL